MCSRRIGGVRTLVALAAILSAGGAVDGGPCFRACYAAEAWAQAVAISVPPQYVVPGQSAVPMLYPVPTQFPFPMAFPFAPPFPVQAQFAMPMPMPMPVQVPTPAEPPASTAMPPAMPPAPPPAPVAEVPQPSAVAPACPAPAIEPTPVPVVAARPVETPVRYGRSVITFDNQSGESALVELVGPTRGQVEVPNGGQNSIYRVASGQYVIRVRFGSPNNYRYLQGDQFTVDETASSYSSIRITLHGVVNGNYGWQPISAAEFAQ